MFRMKRGGFSLVEMLVAMGVIATLIALALPSLHGARESARALACLSRMNGHAAIVQAYAGENREFLPWSFPYDGRGAPPTFFGVEEGERVQRLLAVNSLWYAKVIEWYARDPAHPALYCPSLRLDDAMRAELRGKSVLGPNGRLMTLDYEVSTAFYVDSGALRQDQQHGLASRDIVGQRLGDVTYPANKALMVEGHNLHDPRFDPYSTSGTPRPRACHVVSVAGDGRLRNSGDAIPGIPPLRVEPGPMHEAVADAYKWLLTPGGVRGRDW